VEKRFGEREGPMQMKLTRLLLLGYPFASGADGGDATLRPILEVHRWFDLSDAALSAGKAPALYRGALAATFNDLGRAGGELREAIRSGAGRQERYVGP
jgi:hypothetical protein